MLQKWNWVDGVLFGIRILIFISVLYNVMVVEEQLSLPLWTVVSAVGLSYLVPFLLLMRSRRLYAIGEITCLIALTPYFSSIDATAAGNFISYTLLLGFYQNRSTGYRRLLLPLAAIVIGPLPMLWSNVVTFFSLVITAAVFYGLGVIFSSLIQAKEEIQQKNIIIGQQYKLMEQYAKQVEYATVLKERSRISAELQQTAVHTFASLLMRMELMRGRIQDEAAAGQIGELLVQTRQTMLEIRAAIEQLEPLDEDMSLIRSVERILEEMRGTTPCAMELTVKGDVREVSNAMTVNLTRCLQELLTSAIKAGGARMIGVTLRFTPDAIELRVEDDGEGSKQDRLASGLHKVREQISTHNGQFRLDAFLNKGMSASCNFPAASDDANSAVRVVIVEANPFIRESLASLISLAPGTHAAGQAADSEQALRLSASEQPDIVLLDIRAVTGEMAPYIQRLKQAVPACKVMITSSTDDPEEAIAALHDGADAYFSKELPPQEFLQKIRLVHQGETILSAQTARRLMEQAGSSDAASGQLRHWQQSYGLTDREMDVLQGLAEGLKYREISERLYLAEGTVRNYISNIYAKLEVKDREDAMQLVMQSPFFSKPSSV